MIETVSGLHCPVGNTLVRILPVAGSDEKFSTGLRNTVFRLEKVMHGRVEVSSAIGAGTKVTVSLPKREVKE